jgi:hypothetical protein
MPAGGRRRLQALVDDAVPIDVHGAAELAAADCHIGHISGASGLTGNGAPWSV